MEKGQAQERPVLIQKFGGTSVATAETRAQVTGHVRQALQQGYAPVVVVSAMGRAGAPYATDTLLSLVQDIARDTSPRSLDLLLSCGETISAVIMAETLRVAGIPAVPFTGAQAGIITDNQFGSARILRIQPERIWQALSQGIVPVVAGFQGVTESGEITTLGRGGSDTTAAALGVALRAVEVQIFTDVNGVMTADPRIEPDARTLRTISYREVMEMAQLGAKVIHPRAVEIAMEGRVPLRVLATGSRAPGTLIVDAREMAKRSGEPVTPVEIRSDRVVRAVTQMGEMARVVLTDVGGTTDPQTLEIFTSLAAGGISLDMIQVEPGRIAFAIDASRVGLARSILLGLGHRPAIESGFVKVSAVGGGMQGVPGVMARILRALADANVTVYHTSDSHVNISCLVRSGDMAMAVRALHREFLLDAEDDPPSPMAQTVRPTAALTRDDREKRNGYSQVPVRIEAAQAREQAGRVGTSSTREGSDEHATGVW
ncbi:MAG: aspartate kinase [Limnochordales bacterium]|nr:aspartate kinase [Limnochordales bacterium]